MRVMPSLFEVVYSGENAFHVTVNHFYTIDFTNAPEIKSILGFESDTLVKGLDIRNDTTCRLRVIMWLLLTEPTRTC